MSQDFRIAHPCPHLTVEDRATLAEDRRELILSQPISSAGFVRITVNDEQFIPPAGLFVSAQIRGRLSGPFNIIPNENTLTVRNGRSQVADIALPTGLRVPADTVVTTVNNALVAAELRVQIVKVNGRLVFTDLEGIGQNSRIEIRGKAAGALGFDIQIGARGKQLFPGFDVIKRTENTLGLPDFRFVKFRAPIKGNPIIKATYAAPGIRCLRCRGTFVENDYRFGQDGEPILITNEDLLVQAAQKLVLTEQGSNPFAPWYGTLIHEKVGLKAIGATSVTIHEEVSKALGRFQELQKLQGRVQTVAAPERLFTVASIDTTLDPQDPTFANVDIVVTNASGQPISLSIVFTTPGAVALAGSLDQSLGLGV
jgi:phage baseplate assembly protein W